MKMETEVYKMQKDLIENGPITMTLNVYEDLYAYDGGIYEYTAGALIANHLVRAVGWGHDKDGHLYWIC